MAEVQPEQGTIRYAWQLHEALQRAQLPGRHFRVFMAVVRLTWGWRKLSDRIPVSQLVGQTEIDERSVRRILSDLVAWKLVTRQLEPGRTQILGPQKDFEIWAIDATTESGKRRRRGSGSAPEPRAEEPGLGVERGEVPRADAPGVNAVTPGGDTQGGSARGSGETPGGDSPEPRAETVRKPRAEAPPSTAIQLLPTGRAAAPLPSPHPAPLSALEPDSVMDLILGQPGSCGHEVTASRHRCERCGLDLRGEKSTWLRSGVVDLIAAEALKQADPAEAPRLYVAAVQSLAIRYWRQHVRDPRPLAASAGSTDELRRRQEDHAAQERESARQAEIDRLAALSPEEREAEAAERQRLRRDLDKALRAAGAGRSAERAAHRARRFGRRGKAAR